MTLSDLPSSSRRASANGFALLVSCLGLIACQGGEPGSENYEQSLCPSCSPFSGGETNDFGSSMDCGRMPARPLDQKEQRHFAVEEVLELERNGFEVDISWVANAGERPSRTPPSTLIGVVKLEEPVLVAETKSCGVVVYVPLALTLTTADGALRAHVKGHITREEFRVSVPGDTVTAYDFVPTPWKAEASSNLAEAHGTVDLHLREAWRRAEGRGKRLGVLSINFTLDASGVKGFVGASLGYEADAQGISTSLGPSLYAAAVLGSFPLVDARANSKTDEH